MVTSLKVAVTGVGAPGTWGTLYSLRHNPDDVSVTVVGFDVSGENSGRYLVDEFQLLPRPSDPDYLNRLLNHCRTHSVDVVLPQTTAETAFLAQNRDALEAQGLCLVAPPGAAQSLANSKAELLEATEAAGVPVPRTLLCRSPKDIEDAARAFGYPDEVFVIKPAVSSGSRGFRIVRPQTTSLRAFLDEKPDSTICSLEQLVSIMSSGDMPLMLASEYLPGPEYSVDIFRSGDRFEAVPRRRTSIRTGISNVTELVDAPDMISQSEAISSTIGLEGVFGLQFKENSVGEYRLLECNPRVQGTMVASLLGGFNMVWAGVCHSRGLPVQANGVTSRQGTYYRYWAGLGAVGGKRTMA